MFAVLDGNTDILDKLANKTQAKAVRQRHPLPTMSVKRFLRTLSDDYRFLWGYIPHFVHTPFYVYAYAFGDSLVNALWYAYQQSDKDIFSNNLSLPASIII